jgi:small subunit ribosomal protein S6
LRTYEIAFIAAPDTADGDLTKLNSQIEQIITDRGGRIAKLDNWGRRKLAYRIGKFDEGIYTFVHVEGSGQEIAEVERRLRVTDFIIRHLTVRTDEDLKRAGKVRAKRKSSVAPRNLDEDFDLDLDLEDEELMGDETR